MKTQILINTLAAWYDGQAYGLHNYMVWAVRQTNKREKVVRRHDKKKAFKSNEPQKRKYPL
jgi:hypothetical protein